MGLLAVAAAAALASAPLKYETYVNARFGYSIAYPPALLAAQPVSGNGDGRIFAPKTGRGDFRVYAHYVMGLEGIDDSPKAMADDAAKKCPGGRAAYRVVKPELVAVSCATAHDIFYMKTVIRKDVATTLWAIYPKADKATWDPVIAGMAKSLSPGDSY